MYSWLYSGLHNGLHTIFRLGGTHQSPTDRLRWLVLEDTAIGVIDQTPLPQLQTCQFEQKLSSYSPQQLHQAIDTQCGKWGGQLALVLAPGLSQVEPTLGLYADLAGNPSTNVPANPPANAFVNPSTNPLIRQGWQHHSSAGQRHWYCQQLLELFPAAVLATSAAEWLRQALGSHSKWACVWDNQLVCGSGTMLGQWRVDQPYLALALAPWLEDARLFYLDNQPRGWLANFASSKLQSAQLLAPWQVLVGRCDRVARV